MSKKRRAQFGLEFLMTYGWAILIVLAGLTTIVVIKPEMLLPEKCTISSSSGLFCKDHAAYSSGAGSMVDLSGNANIARVHGGNSIGGYSGSSLNFDGNDDYVEVSDSSSLDVNRVTMMAWVYVDDIALEDMLEPDRSYHPIIEKRMQEGALSYNPSYTLRVMHENYGTYVATKFIAGFTYNNGLSYYESSSMISYPRETWVHIAATYDGSVLRQYLNGELVKTTSRTGTITTSNGPLYMAQQDPRIPRVHYYDGRVDEVRVYGRALSPSEIQTIYSNGDNSNGLVAHYNMETGAMSGLIQLVIQNTLPKPITINFVEISFKGKSCNTTVQKVIPKDSEAILTLDNDGGGCDISKREKIKGDISITYTPEGGLSKSTTGKIVTKAGE